MNEVAQGSIAFLAIVLTAISAYIWMLGGRSIQELREWGLAFGDNKMNRLYYRMIAPLFFSLSLIGISLISGMFQWTFLLFCPLYVVISHLGHHTLTKRIVECILYGLPVALFLHNLSQVCIFGTAQLLLCIIAAFIGHYGDRKAPSIELLVNFLRIGLVGWLCV